MKKEDKEDLILAFFCALLFVLLVIFMAPGCSHQTNPDKPSEAPVDRFAQVEDHAAAMNSPAGWVACINADGSPGCFGDSLLFSGLAMGAADCDHGQPYQDALVEMINANDGILERHPGVPGSSLDGALGLLWGVAKRAQRCPDEGPALAAALSIWSSRPENALDAYFGVVASQVIADLGNGNPPSEHDRGMLGAEIAGWAIGVVTSESAAYRLHLGYLALSLVDAPKGKGSFCAAVEKAKMPLLESFCGRAGLGEWLADFDYNRMEYAHQRAVWESEDPAGKQYAGIDYLVGYRQEFGD